MIDFRYEVYNQEIKERFLNSIDLSQYPPRWWERVFEKTFIFEQSKNKDLYSFTTPDIIEFYKFLDVASFTPLMVYNNNLIKYGQWALNENLVFDGQNHFDELDTDMLFNCVSKIKMNKSILSYEDFSYLISHQIKNEQDKYIFYCLFEGIKGKNYQDIVNMKLKDIDESKMIVHLESRDVPICRRFIDVCQAADSQTAYEGLGGAETITPLIPSETILKEKHNSQGKDINRTVYNTIFRNIESIEELSGVVSAKTIQVSGMIYYLNKRADEVNMSVEDLIYDLDKCRDIIDKYQFNLDTRRRWLIQYKDFLH